MIKLTTEEFIKKAREVHGDKYDYSKVEYKGSREKICIICHKHGEFWQNPYDHLNGHGCTKCFNNEKRGRSRQLTTEEFIKRAKEIHGDKYDYSKVEYEKSQTPVCIICPEHGEFWQKPNKHLNGEGCPKCGAIKRVENKKLSTEQFVLKAKEVHGNKYDYSKVVYKGNKIKVCIICPEHGEFWQKPNSHLSQKQGCPTCSESHIESEVRKILIENGIKFEQEKKFNWLGLQRLDFYLNDYNIAIECQGRQHFEDVGFFNNGKNGNDYLSYIKKLDKKKKELCEKHEVKLYYINFNDNVYEKINEVLDGKL